MPLFSIVAFTIGIVSVTLILLVGASYMVHRMKKDHYNRDIIKNLEK